MVVCAFGALIKEPLLSHPGMLNVHPSLLPRWRGAAPIERAIMAGDAETGVCDHAHGRGARRRAGLPASSASRSRADDTYGTLSARLQPVGLALLTEWIADQARRAASRTRTG